MREGDQAPDRPTRLPPHSWLGVLKRTVREFRQDNVTDWAAALTYYGVLSIFPAIIAVLSILGIFGPSATKPVLDNVTTLAPGPARSLLTSALTNLQHGRSSAGAVFVVSLLGALWAASGYVSAFMRAANSIYDVDEGRPIWKKLPIRVGVTLILIVLLVASTVIVVVSGSLAQRVGNVLGMSGAAITAWNIAKWPVLLAVAALMLAILYYATPNARQTSFRWVTAGGVIGLVIWIVASVAFGFYVTNFGSYNKTYGSVAAVIVFLVWMWISNIAILLGAEFDAELERGRKIESGYPDEQEPFLEPRDTTTMAK